MDCCANKNKHEDRIEISISKKTLLWIIIGLLLIANLYLVFKSPSSSSISAVQSAGAIAKSAASSGMVGGC